MKKRITSLSLGDISLCEAGDISNRFNDYEIHYGTMILVQLCIEDDESMNFYFADTIANFALEPTVFEMLISRAKRNVDELRNDPWDLKG